MALLAQRNAGNAFRENVNVCDFPLPAVAKIIMVQLFKNERHFSLTL
jgi:hypothetical protein